MKAVIETLEFTADRLRDEIVSTNKVILELNAQLCELTSKQNKRKDRLLEIESHISDLNVDQNQTVQTDVGNIRTGKYTDVFNAKQSCCCKE